MSDTHRSVEWPLVSATWEVPLHLRERLSSTRIVVLCCALLPGQNPAAASQVPLDANYWLPGRSGSFRQVSRSDRLR